MAQFLHSIFDMDHDVRWTWSDVAYSSSKSKFALFNGKQCCSAILVNEEGRGDYISALGSSWGGHNGKKCGQLDWDGVASCFGGFGMVLIRFCGKGGREKKKFYDERKNIKQNRETNIKSVLNACEFQFVILDYILTIIALSIVWKLWILYNLW